VDRAWVGGQRTTQRTTPAARPGSGVRRAGLLPGRRTDRVRRTPPRAGRYRSRPGRAAL